MFLFLACVAALLENNAHAVKVYPNVLDGSHAGTTNFYIFNNTQASITSGGDFGFTLPSVDKYYTASITDIAVNNMSLSQGTEDYTITGPSGKSYHFGIWGYTTDYPSAEWRLVPNGDSSWNQTNGQMSTSGAYTIIDQTGSVEQIWNDDYVVTLMFNPQGEGDASLNRYAWIVLIINPNTTSANFFQSGIQNGFGNEWKNIND